MTPAAGTALDPDSVLDRVICVVNNDAITLFELDEAEAYYLYETKEAAPIGEARTALRDRLIQRIIENRLQLQQAEREKIAVEDTEIAEQMADIMKRMNAKNDAELEQALRQQGVTAESVKKRIRDQIMVDRIRRRRVNLRVTVTEQEIDRYVLAEPREARDGSHLRGAPHPLHSRPQPGRGRLGGRAPPRRRRVRSRAGRRRFRRARQGAVAGRLRQGRRLAGHAQARRAGAGYRGRHSSPLARARRRRRSARRSGTTSSAWIRRKRSRATGSTQARNQIRDILLREKLAFRLREWLAEIRQRAIIDMRL